MYTTLVFALTTTHLIYRLSLLYCIRRRSPLRAGPRRRIIGRGVDARYHEHGSAHTGHHRAGRAMAGASVRASSRLGNTSTTAVVFSPCHSCAHRRCASSTIALAAAAVSGLIGGGNAASVLAEATERFRSLPLSALSEGDFVSNADTGLYEKTKHATYGEVDGFISHVSPAPRTEPRTRRRAVTRRAVTRGGRSLRHLTTRSLTSASELSSLGVWAHRRG